MDHLDSLREQIQDIDKKILELTAKRMEMCRQVGALKKQQSIPIKNYQIEKNIMSRTSQSAERLNLEPKLAKDILRLLITQSVIEQEQIKADKASHNYLKSHKNVGIIGSQGPMGQWMWQFFQGFGHNMMGCDTKNSAEPEHQYKIEEIAANADFIVIATPMTQAAETLRHLVRFKSQAIIMEICSLKSPVSTALDECESAGLKIASIHPMFGPNTKLLADKNLIICERGDELTTKIVTDVFKATTVNIHHIEFAVHDKYMSYILGAAHLTNLLFANLMDGKDVGFQDLNRLAGTTFAKQLAVSQDVLSENPKLYHEIQYLNKETPAIFDNIIEIVNSLKELTLKDKQEQFIDFWTKLKETVTTPI